MSPFSQARILVAQVHVGTIRLFVRVPLECSRFHRQVVGLRSLRLDGRIYMNLQLQVYYCATTEVSPESNESVNVVASNRLHGVQGYGTDLAWISGGRASRLGRLRSDRDHSTGLVLLGSFESTYRRAYHPAYNVRA